MTARIMSVAAPPAAASAKSPAPRDSQRIYSIAELSREFAITPRTIRIYVDEGQIKPRRQGTTRLYSSGDRTRLSWILRGKRLVFSLAAILEEAAKLCENVLFPLNRTGDEEGCTYENGVVRTPKGFKHAYDMFREGGWTAVTCDPEYGGQGLPATVGFALQEMFTASNQAFAMYPGLSHGAYEALARHGSDDLKKKYLPKLTDGSWSGTMCLTEPQCGTDLGLIRTRAELQADGSYSITGTKIFISAGEHDLTENILHLVLARLPDAPGGTKGISLFLVPKFLPTPDGKVGERNGIRCGAIEHKMGIKANATCVMNLDGARGWLVG